MKILFINHTRFGGGGATISAQRLAEGLQTRGHKVKWMVKNPGQLPTPNPSDYEVFEPTVIDRILEWPIKGRFTLSPTRLQSFGLSKNRLFRECDVIHFHNLHPSYINFLAIPRIAKSKPVIWTFHDMWPVTGHCGFSLDCKGYKTGCGHCPYLGTYPGVRHDWTAVELKLKRWALDNACINVITPSQWLAKCVTESIGKNLPITVLPYGLDTSLYAPGDVETAKAELGLDSHRMAVLLASANLEDPRKPQYILCDAINAVEKSRPGKIQVLTLGDGDLSKHLDSKIPIRSLGHVSENIDKIRAYNAADVYLFISQGDNLPLVIQESLSCGTPVIANAIGGIPEMIKNAVTGLQVENPSVDCFKDSILQILDSPAHRLSMGNAARIFAKTTYEINHHAEQVEALYQRCYENF